MPLLPLLPDIFLILRQSKLNSCILLNIFLSRKMLMLAVAPRWKNTTHSVPSWLCASANGFQYSRSERIVEFSCSVCVRASQIYGVCVSLSMAIDLLCRWLEMWEDDCWNHIKIKWENYIVALLFVSLLIFQFWKEQKLDGYTQASWKENVRSTLKEISASVAWHHGKRTDRPTDRPTDRQNR